MNAVVRHEIERAVRIEQFAWGRGVAAGVNVTHQDRAGRSPVRLPEFAAVYAVIRHEIEGAVRIEQFAWGRGVAAGVDVTHQDRAGRSPVRLPEFLAVDAIIGS